VSARSAVSAGRSFLLLAVFLLVGSSSCSHVPAVVPAAGESASSAGGPLSVRVSFREASLPGARVRWMRSLEDGSDAPEVSGFTDAEGRVALAVPPGKGFLVAGWRRDGDFARPIAPGDRFAWFGGNPVYAQPGAAREIFIGLEEFSPPPVSLSVPQGATGVAGVILGNGVPVPDVHVSAYLTAAGGFRDLGFAASAPTGSDGSFVMDLPAGKYYLVARKRSGGGVAGPLRKGDLFGYFAANPVAVTAGETVPVSIPVTLLRLRNTPSYSRDFVAAASVEGRILDASGKPIRGAYAALYDNPELLNRPLFLSEVTGADGIYRLPVPVPGKYYLGARSGYGGSPAPGELYGRYEGNPEHSVVLKEGDRMRTVDIVVAPLR
jgi:hypothetical protein